MIHHPCHPHHHQHHPALVVLEHQEANADRGVSIVLQPVAEPRPTTAIIRVGHIVIAEIEVHSLVRCIRTILMSHGKSLEIVNRRQIEMLQNPLQIQKQFHLVQTCRIVPNPSISLTLHRYHQVCQLHDSKRHRRLPACGERCQAARQTIAIHHETAVDSRKPQAIVS